MKRTNQHNTTTNTTIWKSTFLIFVIVVTFGFGMVFGVTRIAGIPLANALDASEGESAMAVDLSDFWETWQLLRTKYPFEEPSSTKKVHGAIRGMVAAYDDPYTMYFPPQEAKSFREEIQGQFGGIGIEVDVRNGLLTVVSPLKGTPAEEAGLEPGDIILAVDGESTENMSINTAILNIRGEVGEPVMLTIARENEPETFDVEIERGLIDIPILDTFVTSDDIGVIQLYSFTEESRRLVEEELRVMLDRPLRGIVLDVRGNPGGVLDQAVEITSLFVPSGTLVTTERDGVEGHEDIEHRTRREPIVPEQLDIVVLINGGSASASEILAGALRDHERAIIVGEQSFGKGSVQELIRVGSDGALKVTVAEWVLPNGQTLRETGLEPDIVVTMDEASESEDDDPVLEAALEVLTD